ncbi:uncharacterized protein LOC105444434 [Strongylocentrotus purpuratus]|uniref:Uncharacterized protein n=1 Tax=Strongylocentrotus purpuratus TaxID=7668 RepID=A0A7M7NBV4_STRPU|nr:uncharacterized protein LOC105444434 [Strongylocentrotus purpuratus]
MSLDVAEIICSMPSLRDISLHRGVLYHDCFFATLARKGNESKVQTFWLEYLKCSTPASSHHLAVALCTMPNLTDLTLGGNLTEEFYSTLKVKASSIQVQTLKLDNLECPTPASSHHRAEALCTMPNLTDLTLIGGYLTEEFCSTLNAKASSIQVKTLWLDDVECPTPASSHYLAEALYSMPNLTHLLLYRLDLTEEFCSTLKAKASSIQGCFPQIRKGNFRLNGVAQDDLNSFLHTLTFYESSDLDCSSDLDGSANSNVSENLADPLQQPMGDVHSPGWTLPSSDHRQQHVSNTSDTVCQFSQTHRECSSSQSRPCKRQAPCTQSRAPQDVHEIPEKQSKKSSCHGTVE